MEKKFLFVMAIMLGMAGTLFGTSYYVNASRADDSGNGLSWAAAKKTFGAAVSLLASDNDVIYVAAGTYRSTGTAWTPGYGVKLYGGYNAANPGGTTRDPDLYETILSGDVNGDDVDIDVLNDPCTCFAMRYATMTLGQPRYENTQVLKLTGKTATVDGFTIRNSKGSAVDCNSATVTFENCYFTQNYSDSGGGCIISTNSTTGNIKVYNCDFVKNSTYGRGVCVRIRYNTPVEMKNCLISQTMGLDYSAAIYFQDSSITSTISDCVLDRCKMFDNTAGCAGIMSSNNTSVVDSVQTLNITNCLFKECQSHDHGAAMYAVSRSTVNLTFIANITNCLVTGCTAAASAQTDIAFYTGIYNTTPPRSFTMNITNCTVMNNNPSAQGAVGGANDASGSTHQIHLKNTILWGNAGGTPADNKAQIVIDSAYLANTEMVLTANYCCLDTSDPNDYGYNRSLGSNNKFTTPSVNSAFFLTSGSNCVNSGNAGFIPSGVTTDLSGRPRSNGTVDIGAYEYYKAGDIDGSGKVNLVDFEKMATVWLDTNCSMLNNWCDLGDTDFDGDVDMSDYNALSANWLQ